MSSPVTVGPGATGTSGDGTKPASPQPAASAVPIAAAQAGWGLPLTVLIAGMFMSVLDISIVNVAIPTIQNDFGVTTEEVQWIATAYSLALGVVVPVSSWLSDKLGPSRTYNLALIGFATGSALCGLAWSLNSMIVFRILQAIPGGILPVVTLTIVYRIVPREKIGAAMGMYGLGIVVAPAVGPTLGGYLVEYVDWRLIFFINVPVGVLGAVAASMVLPRFPAARAGRFDVLGFLTIATGLFSLLLALSEGQDWGWTSYRVLILLTVAALSLALFVIVELEVDEPLLDVRVFRYWPFTNSLLLISVLSVGLFGVLFYIPLFLQQAQGMGAFEAGLLLLPQALMMGVLMPIAGRLYDKIGPRWPAAIGLTIVAIGTYELHNTTVDVTREHMTWLLVFRAAGMGLAMMPIMTGGISAIPPNRVSSASAFNNVVQRTTAALGLAILTSILTSQQAQLLSDRTALITVGTQLPRLGGRPDSGLVGALAVYQQTQTQVFVSGLNNLYMITAGLTAVGVLLALMLRSGPVPAAGARPAPAADAGPAPVSAPPVPSEPAELAPDRPSVAAPEPSRSGPDTRPVPVAGRWAFGDPASGSHAALSLRTRRGAARATAHISSCRHTCCAVCASTSRCVPWPPALPVRVTRSTIRATRPSCETRDMASVSTGSQTQVAGAGATPTAPDAVAPPPTAVATAGTPVTAAPAATAPAGTARAGTRSGTASPEPAGAGGGWGLALLVLIAGMFMSVLDISIVNVAILTMQNDFGVTTDEIQWVATSYELALGVVVPVSSWLSDRFGATRVYNISLAGFAIFSAMCGLAWNLESMIAFRVLQAIPGGILPVVTLAILYRIVPREKIGAAMGMYGLGIVVAPAIGPTLGGYLVEYVDWRLIFFINVPVGILGVAAALMVLPKYPSARAGRFDVLGFLAIATALFTLLLALTEGQDWGWTSYSTLILLTVGVLSMALFVIIELEVDEPLLDVRVFRYWAFTNSLLLITVLSVGLFTVLFYIPLFFQQAQGMGAFETGLVLLPQALIMGVLMPIAGWLYDKIGPRWPASIGLLIVAIGTYLLCTSTADSSTESMMWLLTFRAAGMGLCMMPIMTGGIAAIPTSMVGDAGAFNNVVQRTTAALGLAVLTAMVTSQQAQQIEDRTALIPAGTPMPPLGATTDGGLSAMLAVYQQTQTQVFVSALNDMYIVTALITAAGVVLALMLHSGPAPAAPDDEPRPAVHG